MHISFDIKVFWKKKVLPIVILICAWLTCMIFIFNMMMNDNVHMFACSVSPQLSTPTKKDNKSQKQLFYKEHKMVLPILISAVNILSNLSRSERCVWNNKIFLIVGSDKLDSKSEPDKPCVKKIVRRLLTSDCFELLRYFVTLSNETQCS